MSKWLAAGTTKAHLHALAAFDQAARLGAFRRDKRGSFFCNPSSSSTEDVGDPDISDDALDARCNLRYNRDVVAELRRFIHILEAYQRKFSAFRLQDVAGPGSGSKLGRRASQFVSPMHAMAVVRRQAELEMQASGAINGGAVGGEEAPSSPSSPTRRPTVMLPPRKISYTAASAEPPNPKRVSIMA